MRGAASLASSPPQRQRVKGLQIDSERKRREKPRDSSAIAIATFLERGKGGICDTKLHRRSKGIWIHTTIEFEWYLQWRRWDEITILKDWKTTFNHFKCYSVYSFIPLLVVLLDFFIHRLSAIFWLGVMIVGLLLFWLSLEFDWIVFLQRSLKSGGDWSRRSAGIENPKEVKCYV